MADKLIPYVAVLLLAVLDILVALALYFLRANNTKLDTLTAAYNNAAKHRPDTFPPDSEMVA